MPDPFDDWVRGPQLLSSLDGLSLGGEHITGTVRARLTDGVVAGRAAFHIVVFI
jgi:hypothetical protein